MKKIIFIALCLLYTLGCLEPPSPRNFDPMLRDEAVFKFKAAENYFLRAACLLRTVADDSSQELAYGITKYEDLQQSYNGWISGLTDQLARDLDKRDQDSNQWVETGVIRKGQDFVDYVKPLYLATLEQDESLDIIGEVGRQEALTADIKALMMKGKVDLGKQYRIAERHEREKTIVQLRALNLVAFTEVSRDACKF